MISYLDSYVPSDTVNGLYPTSFASTGTTRPALWKVFVTIFLFLDFIWGVMDSRGYFSSCALDFMEDCRVFSAFTLDLSLFFFNTSPRNVLKIDREKHGQDLHVPAYIPHWKKSASSVVWKYFGNSVEKGWKINSQSFVKFHSMGMFSVVWEYSGNTLEIKLPYCV